MFATPKAKSELFLASSLCDGLEDNNIKQVTTLLLSKEADPNVLIPSYGITPFHLVIGNDSEVFAEEVTKLFLRHGGNPNVPSAEGLTPVHVAAAWGRVGVLELLLANGGDPLRMDDENRTPFHYAFDGKYYGAITVLGRYCTDTMEKDESFKYKRKLDKVLVNNGDMVAEYVVSENSILKETISSDSVERSSHDESTPLHSTEISSDKDNDKVAQLGYSTKNLKFSNALDKNNTENSTSTSNVTFRRHQMNYGMMNQTTCIDIADSLCDSSIEELQQGKESDKEKELVSEIINYLSSSVLNESPDEKLILRHRKSLERQVPDVITTLNRWQKKNDDDELLINKNNNSHCMSAARRVSLIPKLKHKVFEKNESGKRLILSPKTPSTGNGLPRSITQSATIKKGKKGFSKIPVRLEYSPEDCIVSKSPNLMLPLSLKKTGSAKNNVLDKQFKALNGFKDYRKCDLTPTKPESCMSLKPVRGKIARSTPRRKRIPLHKSTNNKELKSHRNYMLKSSTQTDRRYDAGKTCDNSFNSSFLSSSPDFKDTYQVKNTRFNPCAVNLDECKYDDDSEEQISEILTSDTTKFSHNLEMNLNSKQVKDYKDICIIRNTSPLTSDGNSTQDSLNNNNNNNNKCKILQNEKQSTTENEIYNEQSCNGPKNNQSHHVENPERDYSHTKENVQEQKKVLSSEPTTSYVSDTLAPVNYLQNQICKINNTNFGEKEYSASLRSSIISYVSVQEVYKYEDPEEGVLLLEHRYCLPTSSMNTTEADNEFFSANGSCISTTLSSCNVPSEILHLDDRTLRTKLMQLGDAPGPITSSTRQVYLKRLVRLQKKAEKAVNGTTNQDKLQNQIPQNLEYGNWVKELITLSTLEKRVFREFTAPDPSRRWREGTSKTSFNYLLLDSRVTDDLPYRAANLPEAEVWATFVSSIFYIGKGKRSRPYAHLYDAFHVFVSKTQDCPNGKIQRILDIWNQGYGVICLHVFQNIIPVEAYTREAAMIDAMGLDNIKNSKGGEYYGIAATWSSKEKCKFGRYLLYKAMQILMHEGERQLFPQHL